MQGRHTQDACAQAFSVRAGLHKNRCESSVTKHISKRRHAYQLSALSMLKSVVHLQGRATQSAACAPGKAHLAGSTTRHTGQPDPR